MLTNETHRSSPVAATLPFQPRPIVTKLVNMPVLDGYATAIARQWKPGDQELCRLCPRCTAKDNSCLIVIKRPQPLDRDKAPLFTDDTLRWAIQPEEPIAPALVVR